MSDYVPVPILLAEIERLRGVVADYEHRITWDTTCKNCASTYDLSVSQTFRAEEAEARLARVEALVEAWARGRAPTAASELRAALAGPEATTTSSA